MRIFKNERSENILPNLPAGVLVDRYGGKLTGGAGLFMSTVFTSGCVNQLFPCNVVRVCKGGGELVIVHIKEKNKQLCIIM